MYIGKLSALTGATPKAIRLYEALGLLPVAKRLGKYRVYTKKDLVLVHMIRRGLSVGFTLKEMRELILYRQKTGALSLVLGSDLIDAKRAQLAGQIKALQAQDEALVALKDEIQRTFGDFQS